MASSVELESTDPAMVDMATTSPSLRSSTRREQDGGSIGSISSRLAIEEIPTTVPSSPRSSPTHAYNRPGLPPLGSHTEVEAFMIVNPSSGGNRAQSFIASGIQHAKSELMVEDCPRTVNLHIYDMTMGTDGDRPGYHAIKSAVVAGKVVIACACGGDGSVVWMTSEIAKHGIDDSRVYYAVIPYGTGNDFARAFGWDDFNALQPFDMDTNKRGDRKMRLNQLMERWFTSVPCAMDIWEIKLKLHSDGMVKQIKGQDRQKTRVDVRSFKMFNYFSIGIDARIGVGFDRNRTTSQTGNKLVYANEGVKKLFKTDFIPINEWIVDFQEKGQTVIGNSIKAPAKLLSGTKCFMALNVNSYGGGRKLWPYATKLGIEASESSKQRLRQCEQKMGDKQLEWISCLHRSSLGFEQFGHGHTRRLYQGRGNFTINMNSEKTTKDRCYFQVDGEFYQCSRPDTFEVSFDKQVTILTNLESEFVETKYLKQTDL